MIYEFADIKIKDGSRMERSVETPLRYLIALVSV